MSMSLQDSDDQRDMASEVPTVSMSENTVVPTAITEIPKCRHLPAWWNVPVSVSGLPTEVPTQAPNFAFCVLTVQPVRGLPVLEGFGGAV